MSSQQSTLLPINSTSVAGIICFAFSTCFGIASIISTALAYSDDYYDNFHETHPDWDDDWTPADYAGMITGAAFLAFAIAAYPLTYDGGQRYIKQRNSEGIKGLMITSWVFYGILIVNGLSMIVVGATDGFEEDITGWVIYIILWGILGWIFMIVHAERARKSPANQIPPSSARKSAVEPIPVITETTISPDGTRKTIKRTPNPDGSMTVEETITEGTDAL